LTPRGLAISAVLLALVAPAPLAAQPAPHVEVSALAADVAMRPVYLKPIAPLTRQPSAPAQLEPTVHMPAFGVAASVYVSARVHGIVQWSRSTNRSSDAPVLPLPPAPGVSFFLRIRAREHVNRGTIGAGIDVLARNRVRVSGGAGLHIERVTGTQQNFVQTDFQGSGSTTTSAFTHALLSPVLLGDVKVYPGKRLLAFAGLSARLTSASGESAVYQAARLTPRIGVGVWF
jgi:hypothetical protein